jgi:hypothetical protein
MTHPRKNKRLIFFFLDGVGIGEPTEKNPFYAAEADFLPFYTGGLVLPDGTPVKAIDPVLGVEGLPQSGSGQTTLYTGENIPVLLNQHKSTYPTRFMRKILREKNILTLLKSKGLDAVFINAYPVYNTLFTGEHIRIYPSGECHFSEDFPRLFKRRISTTTCMIVIAGQVPFNEKDIRAERTVFQDYTNRWLIEKGLDLPEFSPEKAAEILFDASQSRDFMLYEYFQTDLYAHRHSFLDQVELVKNLNRLIRKLLSLLDPRTDTLLLTSDHGNLEDSTTRSHTRNPVPLLVWGNQADKLRDNISNLTHVTPEVLKFFTSAKSLRKG